MKKVLVILGAASAVTGVVLAVKAKKGASHEENIEEKATVV